MQPIIGGKLGQWGQQCTLHEAMRLMLKLSLSKMTWGMAAELWEPLLKACAGFVLHYCLKTSALAERKYSNCVLAVYKCESIWLSTFEILVNCWWEKMMLWIVVFEAELANVLTRGPSFYVKENWGKTLKIEIWWQYRRNETGQSGRNEILMYSIFFSFLVPWQLSRLLAHYRI